jgi:L-ascorbate metabolism protein UlaG (beta-lactamase superfamily)
MRIKHFLYNAFLIEDEETKIAIDPGLNAWLLKLRSLIPKKEWETVTHVLVTHGDPDHFLRAVPMAKKAGAAVVCGEALMEDFLSNNVDDVHKIDVGEIVKLKKLMVEGLSVKHGPLPVRLFGGLIDIKNEIAQGTHGGKRVFLGPIKIFESAESMHVYSRGTIKFFFGLIKLEKENVDFARGCIGFKITIGDKSVVNLGDSLFQEEWEGLRPDVLMIPIGGRVARNSMDEQEALEAVRLIEPKNVVPCHYNCDFLVRRNFNPADDEMFKREVGKMGIACHIMHYGNEIVI